MFIPGLEGDKLEFGTAVIASDPELDFSPQLYCGKMQKAQH